MKFRVHYVVLTLIFVYFLFFFASMGSGGGDPFEDSHECISKKTDGLDDALLWDQFPDIVNRCSPKDALNIRSFANTDEEKFHVMPKDDIRSFDCTVISLGIGKDVEAERSMKDALPHCEFFGADPVNETNADIFPDVGKFFNIAVGAANGSFRSYILEDIYRYSEVKYVDIATFLRNDIEKKTVDQLMVDIEHAEYEMLPFLLADGQLAKEDVSICQMNIEIHRPNTKQIAQFADFYHSIMKEKQWSFISTSTIIGHLRLYMINHADPVCQKRYITIKN